MTNNKTVITTPTDTQFLITREFDLPKHLVYQAWTTPELIKRWFSEDQAELTTVEMDLQVGGTWHLTVTMANGAEANASGEYQEIVPNERYVTTQVFSDRPDEPIEVIFTLTETDGRTTLTILEEHPSQRYRDEHLAMEESMPGKLDRLEQLMKSVH